MKKIKIDDLNKYNKSIILHDSHLTSIVYKHDTIDFYFSEGFRVVENDRIHQTKFGYIRVKDCNVYDFDCYLIKRKGNELFGNLISIPELSNQILSNGSFVEIYTERYDNCIHWRGELFPQVKGAPISHIIVETSCLFPVEFSWE